MSNNALLMSEYQQLLRDLKGIVEGLLISQVPNVWNVYGGLNRLHNAVENIFKHQFKVLSQNGNLDCWTFIQGLSWLQPDITTSTLSVDSEYQPHLPTHLKTDKVSLWLYRSLESHTLSQKLSWLLSDKEHLMTCYYENAFMLQDKYTEATLICLRSVERNDPSLLSEIDPCLFVNNPSIKDFHKAHRRCSSFPDATNYRKWNILPKKLSSEDVMENLTDLTVDSPKKITNITHKKENSNVKNICGKLKPWRSLPNLTVQGIKIRRRSYTTIKSSSTTPNSPKHLLSTLPTKKEDKLSPSILHVDYSGLNDSHSDKHKVTEYKNLFTKRTQPNTSKLKTSKSSSALLLHAETKENKNVKEYENVSTKSLPCKHPRADSINLAINLVRSAPDYSFSVLPGEKDYKKRPKKSFIEDGGSSVLPMSTGFFPRPVKGQTLTSFLSSSQFSRTNAELDRENAHFSISEAMIAAIEQIKWKRDLKIEEEQVESDEEINNLKQRIRLRRRQKQEEKRSKLWGLALLNEKRIESKFENMLSAANMKLNCMWVAIIVIILLTMMYVYQ